MTRVTFLLTMLLLNTADSICTPSSPPRPRSNSSYASTEVSFKESLGYNEDALLDFTELTEKYGYRTERHTVVTEDGYILTLFRIPRGKNCAGRVRPTPVVLMHGLIDSSDTFIISGPGVGMAYILADACHDVWCPNNRGNHYSRRHLYLDPDLDKNRYWNFTYDEIGMRDISAIVDYVLTSTQTRQVNYIGHSQGTAGFFILTSTRPEYNAKFKLAVCLAPIAWQYHAFSPLLQIVAKATPEARALVDLVNFREIFDRDSLPDKLQEFVCQYVPRLVCGTVLFVVTGLNPKTIRRETLAATFGHFPDATSTKNLLHFGQAYNVDKFQRYDYGREGNVAEYGTPDPPQYDTTRVTVPVALMSGKRDWLSSITDVETLRRTLPNVVDYYIIPQNDWSHVDFTLGDSIPTTLMPKVFQYLNQYG